MPSSWRPLSERENPSGSYDTLADGVPSWLFDSLMEWTADAFVWRSTSGPRYEFEMMKELERRSRRALPGSDGMDKWDSLKRAITNDEQYTLDVVDFVLHSPGHVEREAAESLESILVEAGSSWRVAEEGDHARLERRLGPAITLAAEEAMSTSDSASAHLSIAWSKAFGRNPDPDAAYSEAIRAVEAVAKPAITPNDEQATLGRVRGHLGSNLTSYRTALDHDRFSGIEGAVSMIGLLWYGQHNRHGTDSLEVPIHVSQPSAEAAVQLALVLVEWFRSGVVYRDT